MFYVICSDLDLGLSIKILKFSLFIDGTAALHDSKRYDRQVYRELCERIFQKEGGVGVSENTSRLINLFLRVSDCLRNTASVF